MSDPGRHNEKKRQRLLRKENTYAMLGTRRTGEKSKHMELLVATLAYTTSGRDADVLARIRLIADTVRTAPGLVTSRFYRSRGQDTYYLMLTTWDDDESWQRAQEKYGPKQLLTRMATELLTAAPEQWYMRYLWGYSRPAASPLLAAAHLAHIRKEQADYAELGWIEKLQQQAVQSTLAFAFLARGMQEETFAISRATAGSKTDGKQNASYHQGSFLLNLFSWGSEQEREEFYSDPNYQAINRFVSSTGTIRVLSLEPM